MKKAYLILLTLFFTSSYILGQENLSNIRTKIILIDSDTVLLDTLSVIPGTFIIDAELGPALKDSLIIIDYAAALLILKKNKKEFIGKKVNVKYRVFPYNFSKKYGNRNLQLILPDIKNNNKVRISSRRVSQPFDINNELKKNGSISRGIMLGNQQDLSTVSNLNMQLSGKINDEVSILAAISDNNLPIQPEGNTQQIQEFDKVFVQLFTKSSGVIVGDFELNKPIGYYMNLNKKNRGIKVYSNFNIGNANNYKLYSDFSVSMAKGKYNRLKFNGIEGNQGPYRLTGTEKEQYIIILSGSEKIYIDGELLTRGQNYDYIIDYNSAEITFTQNRLITKDSRITAEFEYAQQQYPRMAFYQTNKLSNKNNSFWLNFYHDRDNKNDPLSLFYDENTKYFLSNIGDSIHKAIVPNIDSIGYNEDMILYGLVDTIVNGTVYDSVYRQSYNPEKAVYRLGFSYVGENRGHYVPAISTANGKVYEWKAPVNNEFQGSYEPVVLLITPKNQLLTTAGGAFNIGKFGRAFFELALSNYNINTYSVIDKDDDPGYAMKFQFKQSLINADTNQLKLNLIANYQFADKKFKPIENYHPVEFNRDWNAPTNQNTWEEQRVGLGLYFFRKNLGIAGISTEILQSQINYLGKKASFYSKFKQKGFEIDANLSYLQTENLIYNTSFLRHKLLFAKHLKYFTVGLSENTELNQWDGIQSDSLSLNSFSFSEYKIFLNQPDSSKQKYFISYKIREDKLPFNNALKTSGRSKDFGAGLTVINKKGIRLNGRLNYRELEIKDTTGNFFKEENSLTGRSELQLQLFKNSISWSTFYETGFGFETKKDYLYIEVVAGQGQFTWIDYNQNNIKELDEFEYAKFQDEANYIRIVLPGNETEKIFLSQLNQSINLQPDRVWLKSGGIRQILSHFSNRFAISVMQKSGHDNYIPDIKDHAGIINLNWNLRNVFSFRSSNRNWQIDYIYDENKLKIPLVSGTEFKQNQKNSLKIKWRVKKLFTVFNTASAGYQSKTSESFSWKSYNINNITNDIGLQFQPKINWYGKISYRYTDKLNSEGIEKSQIHEVKLSYNQSIFKKGNVQASFSMINVNYNSDALSPIAYEMLEGLLIGQNLIWEVSFNQRLSEIFQLSINYNGRVAENSPVIHFGGVQLRANF
ncbi:MAG: hypothetical protein ABFS35_19420 [Bacteroidota bacterium]